MPGHGYVPSCDKHEKRKMEPIFLQARSEISKTTKPQDQLFWYCPICGRLVKDVWN